MDDDIPDAEYFRQINRIYELEQQELKKQLEDARDREFQEAYEEGLRLEREKREKKRILIESGQYVESSSSEDDDQEDEIIDDLLPCDDDGNPIDCSDDSAARLYAFEKLKRNEEEREKVQKEMKIRSQIAVDKYESEVKEFWEKEDGKPTFDLPSNQAKQLTKREQRGPPVSLNIDEVLCEKNQRRIMKIINSSDNANGQLNRVFRRMFYGPVGSFFESRKKSIKPDDDTSTAKKLSIGGKLLGRPPKKPEEGTKKPTSDVTSTPSDFVFKPILLNADVIPPPKKKKQGNPSMIGHEFKRPKPGRPRKDESEVILTPTSALSTSPSPPIVPATQKKKTVRPWEVGKAGRPQGSGGGSTRFGAPNKKSRF